ncbi:DNA methyltransferase [Gemmata sp.]|uniref:DNA methyltransferase n=1 Tax=Gemmata sp. TaxID=1914242 RepID=UPI003F6F4C79
MTEDDRKRRALTHVGGRIDTAGDAPDAKLLAHAVDVPPSTDADGDPSRAHVHGFHTYPARMHPDTAARLVKAFSPEKGRVLDPFCGSGTVLVEAMIAGRNPLGTDLNPLAVRLARCKTRPREEAELEYLVEKAIECSAHAEERRRTKAGATRRLPQEDVELFEPHVLLELDSLRDKVMSFHGDRTQQDLMLVLSSVLVKLSKKRGDTATGTAPRRTSPGFASKVFLQKAGELARAMSAFRKLLPTPLPRPAFVKPDNATELTSLPAGPVDAVITSPPYAATYDYLEHHSMRLRWLGLSTAALQRGEMGSRSAYRRIPPAAAAGEWSRELSRFFTAVSRALRPGGPLVLLMADSAVGPVALRADEIVAETARACGFYPAARASQVRPHFHGPTMAAFRARPRAEHAILLRKT